MHETTTSGPLSGITVLELAGIGPGPYAAMLLAELGARVIRVQRPGVNMADPIQNNLLNRSRPAMVLDLKVEGASQLFLEMVTQADVVLEGWRPGVAEKLGIGPEECQEANPKIVYARMTGWGQTGPLAERAGHDINFAGLTGAIHATGGKEKPRQAVNMVADFGGGSTFLIIGILAALLERNISGQGQVVDVAMVDGAASLMSLPYGLHAENFWVDERESNIIDGGAPFYDVYECADGKFMTVGCLEPQFYQTMMSVLELEFDQYDQSVWPQMRTALTEAFLSKTRDEWAEIFEPLDACVYPVLSLTEAPQHPQMKARNVFAPLKSGHQPAAAPQFSRTPIQRPGDKPSSPEAGTAPVLKDLGFTQDRIEDLANQGIIRTQG